MIKNNDKKQDEKICWACKRVITGKSTFGLCPNCVNKYGTPAACVVAIGIGVGGKKLLKNSGKIINVAVKIAKNLKT